MMIDETNFAMPSFNTLAMNRFPTSIVAGALTIVFSLFNVGLPMVMHFCPMMQESAPCCAEASAPTGQLQLSNQMGDCCGTYIVAERNTTPFLKAVRAGLLSHEQEWTLPPAATISLVGEQQSAGYSHLDPPLLHVSTPLFVLNAALLI
jgi:hypothetical protein